MFVEEKWPLWKVCEVGCMSSTKCKDASEPVSDMNVHICVPSYARHTPWSLITITSWCGVSDSGKQLILDNRLVDKQLYPVPNRLNCIWQWSNVLLLKKKKKWWKPGGVASITKVRWQSKIKMQFFACLLLAQCKNTSEEHARQEQTHAGALKRKKGRQRE